MLKIDAHSGTTCSSGKLAQAAGQTHAIGYVIARDQAAGPSQLHALFGWRQRFSHFRPPMFKRQLNRRVIALMIQRTAVPFRAGFECVMRSLMISIPDCPFQFRLELVPGKWGVRLLKPNRCGYWFAHACRPMSRCAQP